MAEKKIQLLKHVALMAGGHDTGSGGNTEDLMNSLKRSCANLRTIAEYLFSSTGVSCVSFHDLLLEKIIREGLTGDAFGRLASILSSLAAPSRARLLFRGYDEGLPVSLQELFDPERQTGAPDLENTLIWFFNYSGKREIVSAARKLSETPADVALSAEAFEKHLLTAGFPDPDLLIVTGGESFLPDFMTYQIAYMEMYFSPKSWDVFGVNDLKAALKSYSSRERRYGNV